MATYTNTSFNYPARFGRGECGVLSCEEATRVYANGDIVKGPKIAKGNKIVDAYFATGDIDTNGSPTATCKLRINDGSTQVKLIDVTAAQLSTTGGIMLSGISSGNYLNFNHVVPTDGYWLEVVFDAAFATAATGVLAFGILVTNNLWTAEQP